MGATKITLTGSSESLFAGFTKVNTLIDYALEGDGTTRFLRVSKITVEDGTVADSIKVTMSSVFNGDALAAEDSLIKSGDTGYFNLNSDGSEIHIEAGGITGDATHILWAGIYSNDSNNVLVVQGTISLAGITLAFKNATNNDAYDLTAAVDRGNVVAHVLYLTNA